LLTVPGPATALIQINRFWQAWVKANSKTYTDIVSCPEARSVKITILGLKASRATSLKINKERDRLARSFSSHCYFDGGEHQDSEQSGEVLEVGF
jgi:hypothetical protein